MDVNDLKRYTVILGGGSGVLFQPLDENKTYILTAKHILYKDVKNDRGQNTGKELLDKINFSYSNNQSNSQVFEIKKGENYFEHDDADAAILVLEENLGFNDIFIDDRTTGFDDFSLTGYPNSKRNADDKYDRHIINNLISSNDNLILLRLSVDHLGHDQITGFSGGGIMKINGDSLLLSGIQSKTPIKECSGEIDVVPIKRFEEIVDENNLSKLLPNYFSKIDLLINAILEFNQTNPTVIAKFQSAFKIQSKQIKCELKDFHKNIIISKSSILNSSLKSKAFWLSFIEYALIISLLEDKDFNEDLFLKISRHRKFVFSDSSENIYNVYKDVAHFASENIENDCQVLLATKDIPKTEKTRRMSMDKVPKNIFNVDDNESIDRIVARKKIKEIIHIKAIEYDCLNLNEDNFLAFEDDQFEEILTEIKRLINEFFNN